jgi:hypothetical protein
MKIEIGFSIRFSIGVAKRAHQGLGQLSEPVKAGFLANKTRKKGKRRKRQRCRNLSIVFGCIPICSLKVGLNRLDRRIVGV